MNAIDVALSETLADLIRSRTYCDCCDNAGEHLHLIARALKRTPVDQWPDLGDVFADDCDEAKGRARYSSIYEALKQRTKEGLP